MMSAIRTVRWELNYTPTDDDRVACVETWQLQVMKDKLPISIKGS